MVRKIILLIFVIWITCAATMMTKREAMDYLSYYGYMTKKNESEFSHCLKKFQKVAAIPMTGEMDAMTDTMMQMPRCGCTDGTRMRGKRYTIHGSKWRVDTIKYNADLPPSLKHFGYDSLRRAFKEWSKYAGITFVETNPKEALINLSFTRLDRPEMVGKAQFPIVGGNIFFSDECNWTDLVGSGVNLYQVALHEIGHSLGLGHSRDQNSVMYPYYDKTIEKHKLTDDDIHGIKILYGES